MPSAGDKRSKKAAKRKKKLEQRQKGRSSRRPAEHWDDLFGAAVRFAYHYLSDRSSGEVVGYLARGRLPDGRRVLKAFLDAADLTEEEVTTVRGWTALQPTLYECLELRGSAAVLRDLLTWKTFTVHAISATPLQAFEHVRFAAGVVLPTPDGPVVGGEMRGVRPDATESEVLDVAGNLCRRHWRYCQRAHPEVVAGMLRREREAFVSALGSAWVDLEPHSLVDALNRLQQAMPAEAVDGFLPAAAMGVDDNEGPTTLLHDLRYGLVLAPGATDLVEGVRSGNRLTLEAWLSDGSISPAVFDAVHEREGEALDALLSDLLGSPTLWPDARETLIQRHKPAFARPVPHLFPIPEAVARAWSGRPPLDGIGMNALLGMEAL